MSSKKITCLAIIVCVFFASKWGLIVFDMPIVSLVCAFMIPVFGFKAMMLIRASLVTLTFMFQLGACLTLIEMMGFLFFPYAYGICWAYTIGFYLMFKKRLIY